MSTGHPNPLRLVADIGGTHTRIAIVSPPSPVRLAEWLFTTSDFHDLATPLRAALKEWSGPSPTEAFCAVASPLKDDFVALTNVGWSFSLAATQKTLGLTALTLVNDWVAQAWAVPHLRRDQRDTIAAGEEIAHAPILVLGPGTGLGSAALIPQQSSWQAIACEGGHISFSPDGSREAAIVEKIRDEFGHCSGERVASGIGIAAVYSAICALEGVLPISDSPERISTAALNGNPQANETMQLFSAALGSITGDLALALGARGGVYIGGGLIPALGPLFDQTRFYQRFLAKGRFRHYLSEIPIWQILPDDAAFIGLAAAPSKQTNRS